MIYTWYINHAIDAEFDKTLILKAKSDIEMYQWLTFMMKHKVLLGILIQKRLELLGQPEMATALTGNKDKTSSIMKELEIEPKHEPKQEVKHEPKTQQ